MNQNSKGHHGGNEQKPVIAKYPVCNGNAALLIHRFTLRSTKPIGALEHWLATIGVAP